MTNRKKSSRSRKQPAKASRRPPKKESAARGAPFFESEAATECFVSLRQGNLGKTLEWAEDAAAHGADEMPVADLSLLALSAYSRARQHRKAVISGRRFLEETSGATPLSGKTKNDLQLRENLAYALNLIGLSHRESGDSDLARACFESALEYTPEYQPAYLNWAALEKTLGNRPLAKRIVDSGLKRAAGSDELRLVKSEFDRPTVSVCMIVKDEEQALPRCLESVRDLADEIIVVDTGSTDNTIKIAESFGCKVFEQPWEGDFSKHRNHSIAQASCDWVFIIDADECLIAEDAAELRRCLAQDTHPILSLTVYNLAERSGKAPTFLPSVRLFRRELGLRYEGIVHNRLNYPTDTAELRCQVGIRHYGYDLEPEVMKRKQARSRRLLEKQLESNPDFAPAHFNLAQLIRAQTQLRDQTAANEVLSHAKRAIELTSPDSLEYGSIHLMAHHQAATASLALGEFAEAVSFCKAALEIKPDYLDALISVGHANLALNQLDEAEKEFKRFLEIAANYSEHTETNTLIIIHLNSRDNALYNLGKIQEARERWSEALKHYAQAQRLSEPYLDCHARLGWCEYRLGSYESAQKHFKAQIEADPTLDSAHMGLAGLAIDAAQADRAEAILRNGISLASDTRLLSGRLAELLIKHGRTEEGLAITEQALTSYPEFGPLLAVRGNALNALGRFEEAVESFQRSEELKSGMAMTALGLANALLSLERNQEAVTWFKLALGRDPYSALARRNLAIALIRVGELVASEEHLRSYLEVATDDRQARFILAALLFELNRPLESVAIYETLLREDPSDQEALLALSDCYAATGSIDSAGAGYRRLLQMNPAHPLAAERLSILSGAGGS